jgi:hypothetical protein
MEQALSPKHKATRCLDQAGAGGTDKLITHTFIGKP